jgi:type IV pilus assembly protein PilW
MKGPRQQAGVTLVELMVALSIGSFLMIGAVQVYNQSREAFVVNESIARVQETAQFAMDTIEADLRMASNWGRQSRGFAIVGRSVAGDPNPLVLPVGAIGCGASWALDLGNPVTGDNNGYGLGCAPDPMGVGVAQPNSDTVTTRRTTVAVAPLQAGRLQVQSTRIQAEVFADGNVPASFDPAESETHNLLINTYYVADSSTLIPGVPTLRRKTLVVNGGGPGVDDQEVAPGVENIQLQFGLDVDDDNTVDRYVNPGDPVLDPLAAGFIPGAKIMTARIWMIVRGVSPEPGVVDQRNYAPGDVALGMYNDTFRRMQVSKTILLRNARS